MSTYSPILRTELIGAGEQPGTWGSTTNSNFQYIFESAIAGYQAVTVSPTSNNQVLTYVNGPSAAPSLNQSIYAMLKLDAGTLGAAFNIYAPPVSKTYIIWNNTSYATTFYNSTVIGNTTAAGSGAVIPAGARVMVWSDGTSFYSNNSIIGNLTVNGNLEVTGSTTLTGVATFTAQPIMSTLTASRPVFTDSSKGLVSAAVTGTGDVVLAVSPTFTGAPLAPTATAGTSTTQIATTAFTTAAITAATGSLGTMSTQNANAVAITGGTITGITDLTVADGGTGASTFTANSVVLGNGTSSLAGNMVAPGTSGNLLVSNGTTWTSATLVSSGVKLGLGITGETWHNLTGSRSANTTYTNNYAYPIMVTVQLHSGSSGTNPSYLYVSGIAVGVVTGGGWTGGMDAACSAIVPPGATYSTNSSAAGSLWTELY